MIRYGPEPHASCQPVTEASDFLIFAASHGIDVCVLARCGLESPHAAAVLATESVQRRRAARSQLGPTNVLDLQLDLGPLELDGLLFDIAVEAEAEEPSR